MHYVEFPEAVRVTKSRGGERVLVEYQEFLDENVWTDPKWRSSEEYARAYRRLVTLFDAAFAKAARGVGIADKDYEKWEPIAALRTFQVPPENVRPISVFTDAAIFATTEEPDWAKDVPRSSEEPARKGLPAKSAKALPAKPAS